jgi:hypothetical protein
MRLAYIYFRGKMYGFLNLKKGGLKQMNRKRKYGISTIARILFALVMIMGIAVGNVFAKYVTKEEGKTEEAFDYNTLDKVNEVYKEIYISAN